MVPVGTLIGILVGIVIRILVGTFIGTANSSIFGSLCFALLCFGWAGLVRFRVQGVCRGYNRVVRCFY